MKMLLQSYLFAWLFALGISLGSMANLMVLTLTGGRWALPLVPAWRAAARLTPWVAIAFVPIAVGVRVVYPWTATPGAWLNVPFFIGRAVACLAVWSVLAWGYLRAREAAPRWSAAGLIVYTFTVSVAAFDWIASLMPGWFSSGFGLVVATGQMLCAAAFAIAWAGFAARSFPGVEVRAHFQDMGNLLLMYVLTWMYLAYTQFLVIWSENIPREIQWYVPRLQTGWNALGVGIVALHFVLPFLILLSRAAKRSPVFLATIAAVLLAAHVADVYWLVMPSVRPDGFSMAWTDPLALAVVVAAWTFGWRRSPEHAHG